MTNRERELEAALVLAMGDLFIIAQTTIDMTSAHRANQAIGRIRAALVILPTPRDLPDEDSRQSRDFCISGDGAEPL